VGEESFLDGVREADDCEKKQNYKDGRTGKTNPKLNGVSVNREQAGSREIVLTRGGRRAHRLGETRE